MTEDYYSLVDWDTLGKAMNNITLPQQWFISNHSSGMCRVEKFTVIWKETETADCPRCGQLEDAKHVWHCQAIPVQHIWDSQLNKLHKWLVTLYTDSEIIAAIVSELNQWYHCPNTDYTTFSTGIMDCINLQDQLERSNFIEGFIH